MPPARQHPRPLTRLRNSGGGPRWRVVHSGCYAAVRAQTSAVRSSGCQRFEAGMCRRVAIEREGLGTAGIAAQFDDHRVAEIRLGLPIRGLLVHFVEIVPLRSSPPCQEGFFVLIGDRDAALVPVFRPLDDFLLRWARRKYGRFRSAKMQMYRWLKRVQARQPLLFPHWALEGRLNNGSRMNGDVHVRF